MGGGGEQRVCYRFQSQGLWVENASWLHDQKGGSLGSFRSDYSIFTGCISLVIVTLNDKDKNKKKK